MRDAKLWESLMNAARSEKLKSKIIKKIKATDRKETIYIAEEMKALLISAGELRLKCEREGGRYIYRGFVVYLNGRETDMGLIEITRAKEHRHYLVNASIMEKVISYNLCYGDNKVAAYIKKPVCTGTKKKNKHIKIYIGRIVFNKYNNYDVLHNHSYEIHHCFLRCNNMAECLIDTKKRNHAGEYGNYSQTQSVVIGTKYEFDKFFGEVERQMLYFKILQQNNLY